MKIYDCFMFFDEEMLLDLRLNILDQYVDKFVITESKYMHSGRTKKLIFDINKYKNFKDKIIYNVVSEEPSNIESFSKNDSKKTSEVKFINNSNKREHYQREIAQKSLEGVDDEDLILVNDIDEIPNLKNINFNEITNKLIFFKQKMFFYKFNLLYETKPWCGSRACKKKYFLSPQWLRDVREKKYPLWRFDILFSKTKYRDILYIEDGGWHFTNIKSPSDIEKKLLNYTHHYEYEQSGLTLSDLQKKILERKIIYDHSVDQREFKWGSEKTLTKIKLTNMPDYLRENYKKYANWLEN